MTKKMIMGAAVAVLSLGALQVPTADAHGWHKWHHRPFFYITTQSFGCGEYYWKWQRTGSFFWKKRYFLCREYY